LVTFSSCRAHAEKLKAMRSSRFYILITFISYKQLKWCTNSNTGVYHQLFKLDNIHS